MKDSFTYVGMSKDLERRLKEHNSGSSRYTKGHMPWSVIHTEYFGTWSEARIREKYLKSTRGKEWLKEIGVLNKEI
jgi:putative endonuclease